MRKREGRLTGQKVVEALEKQVWFCCRLWGEREAEVEGRQLETQVRLG
jgi:hypothetical protein